MSHNYQPQSSDISTKLYWTFFWGIVLGVALGYGIRGIVDGGQAPVTENVAKVENDGAQSAPEETPAPPETQEVPSEKPREKPVEVEPIPEEPPAGPFDADVKGLWPARHVFVGVKGTKASVETLEWLNEFKPGGIVLGPENVKDPLQFGALVLQLKQAVGLGTTIKDPPFLLYRDEGQAFPAVAASLEMAGADINTDLKASALAQARAARAHGIGAFIAPSLDLYLDGVSAPALEAIALGDQPAIVAEKGLTFLTQCRAAGVLSVATHFPGAGLAVPASGGSWQIPAAQMDGLAAGMQPFQEAIAAGIGGLLVGHMAVPGIDVDAQERPASRSEKLLKILLRDKLGFEGVAIAEDIGQDPALGELPLERIAVTALVSGCDAVILQEADRESLRAICAALVRLNRMPDFPKAQLAASKGRLDAWHTQLAAPVKAPEVVVTPVVLAKADEEKPSKPEEAPEAPAEPAPEEAKPSTSPDGGEEKPPVEATESSTTIDPPATESTKPEDKKPETKPDDEKGEDAQGDDSKPEKTDSESVTVTETPASGKPEEAAATPENREDKEEAAPGGEKSAEDAMSAVDENTRFEEHTIDKGDTLIELANRYGVSVADLTAWNNLESQTIKYGFKLKVRPLPGEAEEEKVAETSEEAKKETGDAGSEDKGKDQDTPSDDSESAGDKKPESASDAAPAVETVGEPGNLESVAVESPTPETNGDTSDVGNSESDDSVPVIGDGSTPPEEMDTETLPAEAEEASDPKPESLTGATPEEEPVAAAPLPESERTPQPPNTDKRSHEVKDGDTVASVAGNFGVAETDLVSWNGLPGKDTPLETGTTLVVYLPMAAEEAPVENAADNEGTEKSKATPDDPSTYVVHEVVAGDNLRRIAQKYGVSQQSIIDLNKIERPDHVQLGWKLKIPKKD